MTHKSKWEKNIDAGIKRFSPDQKERFGQIMNAVDAYVDNFMAAISRDYFAIASSNSNLVPAQDIMHPALARFHELLHDWENGKITSEYVGACMFAMSTMLQDVAGELAKKFK